ncbi:RNA helicase, putative [Trypanosoma brucei gambiense DAL972]|uniref:RNA helicase n=1 Tax=Trypanosoma brucei gambiense (strain MHOM/CI/86/DAL972) TaxID=679716 RepID=D0A3F8_TRYB9|nr:RNA helicase, putative [Trypanosoma brucei gambiense DAL972]CBH15802.1 RNA helicase, putative [Trypanosoma brucei gambiense DAL972]|eukprot:XP_011778066.1 RNA helicase, putative [Trypanosoma brucei gambiense DAL972]
MSDELCVLRKLQLIYSKNELYHRLEHVLGRPESAAEAEGLYDDVEGLVSLFAEANEKKRDSDDSKEVSAEERNKSLVDALDSAINGDENDEPPIQLSQLQDLACLMRSLLGDIDWSKCLAAGALAIVEQERREIEETLRQKILQEEEARRDANEGGDSAVGRQRTLQDLSVDPAERRAAMKVRAEEKMQLAQLVRTGLLDESELLQVKTDDEDVEQVELNEEEPLFLRGLVRHKPINYRALLPSEQLMRASTPAQREAIIARRVVQQASAEEIETNTMKRAALAQQQRNKERQILQAKERRQQRLAEQARGFYEPNDAVDRKEEGDDEEGNNEEDGTHYKGNTFLDRELLERPEEHLHRGGLGRGSRSALPPWMKHSFGEKPRFGMMETSESLAEQRRSLPIYAFRDRFLQHVDAHAVTVLVGETGSGKTTQIPQYLVEHGYGKNGVVCCTQPRRVAAETLAIRVAEEYGCRLGEEVGYTVRFRDVTSSLTCIKYMTDGMLLREALLDDSFQRYSVIILDEAHERSVNTDLLFAIVRNATHKRPTLKVIVTSATLEREKFCSYFNVHDVFFIEGRTFPVDTYFLAEPTEDYLDCALKTVMKLHLEEPPGDVLVFLTGQEEIEFGGDRLFRWMERLRGLSDLPVPDMLILPLTATLPQDVQSRVFEPTPPHCRKVVLATNVAETSITISNLSYVVDSGYSKQNVFDPKTGMEQLKIMPISQAQARQRAGRAGRIGPGKCFRMYTEIQFRQDMDPATVPDIQRSNLFHVVLQLKAMGINDLFALDLMDPPPQETLVTALQKLRYLEALDEDGLLTPLGGRMAHLPIDPSHSKTLLTAVDLGCSEPVLTIVSMLAAQKRGVFYRPRDQHEAADAAKRQFHQPEGDHITLLAVYDAWVANGLSENWCKRNFLKHRMLMEARDTRDQLSEMLRKRHTNIEHHNDSSLTEVRRAITAGYFFNAARRITDVAYATLAERREVYVHPSSCLRDTPPKYLLYNEVQLTSREYMREILAIEPRWLVELAPAFYSKPRKGKLTKEQRAERLNPILRAWESGNSWRISKQRRRR